MPAPRYLLPGEFPRVNVLRHWAVLLAPGLRAGAVLAVLYVLFFNVSNDTIAGLLSLGMAAVLGWFGWKVAEWRHDRFVVTDKRVLVVTGLITKRIGMMPLLKVTDMTYERSWLGRRLSYGAFVMESAGQDQALHRIDFVPEPEQVSQTMFQLLFGAPAGGARPPERHPTPDPRAPQPEDYPTDPNLPVVTGEDAPGGDGTPSNVRLLGRRDLDPPTPS